MEKTILFIINSKISKNSIFDTHSIIEYIIQHHSDIYLSSHKSNWTTKYYHSEISKIISKFEGNVINLKGECWSLNIHKKFTLNKCWIKL